MYPQFIKRICMKWNNALIYRMDNVGNNLSPHLINHILETVRNVQNRLVGNEYNGLMFDRSIRILNSTG